MKKNFLAVFLFVFLFSAGSKKLVAQGSFSADATLQIMEKVADWQLATWEKEGMRWPKTDWTNGAAYAGFMALNQKANNSKYINAMYAIGDATAWNPGPRRMMRVRAKTSGQTTRRKPTTRSRQGSRKSAVSSRLIEHRSTRWSKNRWPSRS